MTLDQYESAVVANAIPMTTANNTAATAVAETNQRANLRRRRLGVGVSRSRSPDRGLRCGIDIPCTPNLTVVYLLRASGLGSGHSFERRQHQGHHKQRAEQAGGQCQAERRVGPRDCVYRREPQDDLRDHDTGTALSTATASSGAPACSSTRARSRETGIPALRSRANWRRRSSTLVVTATARLQPASTSVPIKPRPTTRPNSS